MVSCMREINELARVFAGINDSRAMKKFFNEIFTEAERKDFALRWQLMKMLNKKVPQRKIATELKISLCKITRGAKILKDNKSVSYKIINKKK